MADDAPLLIERRGPALWLTINREARRNAMNPAVLDGIHHAVTLAARDGTRAIVLTGAGDKAFCAGADLSVGTDTFTRSLDEPTTDFGRLARAVRESSVPMIARVNGACVAGGMGLLGLCDLAVAVDHARFGLPEIKVGVFAFQVLVYLRNTLSARHINELCLTADLIDAATRETSRSTSASRSAAGTTKLTSAISRARAASIRSAVRHSSLMCRAERVLRR